MTKESHPLDDFFRESLKDLKVAPSANARGRFLEEAAHIGGRNGAGFWRWFSITSVAILITTSAALFFLFRGSEQDSLLESPSPVSTTYNQVIHSVPKTTVNTSTPIPAKNEAVAVSRLTPATVHPISKAGFLNKPVPQVTVPVYANSPINQVQAAVPHEIPVTIEKKEQIFISDSQGIVNSSPPPVAENTPTEVASSNLGSPVPPGTQLNSEASSEISSASELAASTQTGSANPETDPEEKPAAELKSIYNPTRSPWQFTPYLAYGFDWVFNKPEGVAVNSLGLEGVLQHGRFSLTLRSGISASKNQTTNQALYNDYLGNYKKLDSITFAWDDKHYYLVPTYHMSENKVWDSTVKSDHFLVSKRYRIMHVPLMLGYDLLQQQKFQLSLRAGVGMSFCLDSRKLSGDYSAGQNRLITIKQGVDDYTKSRYFLLADFVASYALTRKLFLDMQPHIDYLLNPADAGSKSLDKLLIPGIKMSLKYKL